MALSLYLHYPFCFNKCSYCDFYKEVYQSSLEDKYFDALMIETKLAFDTDKLTRFKEIDTIFIGGGTPSLVNIDKFKSWLNLVNDLMPLADRLEFSIECNPESVTLDNLSALKELGVTRPTFGVQTFDEKMLKILDRRHNPHQTQRAVYYTNALGFKKFGVDLIFGLPEQTSKKLSKDIDLLLDLDPPHISFYQLIIEEGTPLYAKDKSGQLKMPSQDETLAMYRSGCEKFREAGYTRYEISSFAKPGYECRHNIGYWQGKDYIGLGPSAHSFIDGKRFFNRYSLSDYVTKLSQNELPREVDISKIEDRMTESILMELRTVWGISRKRFYRRFNLDVEDRFNLDQFEMFKQSGHIIEDDDKIMLSDDGVYIVEEICRRLIK